MITCRRKYGKPQALQAAPTPTEQAVTSSTTPWSGSVWFCRLGKSVLWRFVWCPQVRVNWLALGFFFLSLWERPHLSHLMSFKVFLGMNLSILLSQVRLPAVPAVSYLSSQVCVWRCEDPCQEHSLMPDSREILETIFRITHDFLMDSFSGKNAYCWYYS